MTPRGPPFATCSYHRIVGPACAPPQPRPWRYARPRAALSARRTRQRARAMRVQRATVSTSAAREVVVEARHVLLHRRVERLVAVGRRGRGVRDLRARPRERSVARELGRHAGSLVVAVALVEVAGGAALARRSSRRARARPDPSAARGPPVRLRATAGTARRPSSRRRSSPSATMPRRPACPSAARRRSASARRKAPARRSRARRDRGSSPRSTRAFPTRRASSPSPSPASPRPSRT